MCIKEGNYWRKVQVPKVTVNDKIFRKSLLQDKIRRRLLLFHCMLHDN